jgi:hypothetical protein
MKIFTKEFNIAGLITLLFISGTYFEIPPFSTIIDIGAGIKEAAAKKYGEPPYGHAELSSLKTFAAKMGINSKEGMDVLRKAGYLVNNENQTLQELAHQNRISPQQIYQAMQPDTKQAAIFSETTQKLPETPALRTGNLTLVDFCHQYNLNVKKIVRDFEHPSELLILTLYVSPVFCHNYSILWVYFPFCE